ETLLPAFPDGLAISPDGKRIAVPCRGDGILVLDSANGGNIGKLDVEDQVKLCGFSDPHGNLLAVTAKGAIVEWNPELAEQWRGSLNLDRRIEKIAIDRKGELVAFGTSERVT